MAFSLRLRSDDFGTTITEYALLIALIALVGVKAPGRI
jgi:Flp pilus assembly pilin Flp